MKKKILSNIFASLVDKFFLIGSQILTAFIVIRFIDRDDYGIIGIVAGYYVFVSALNVSLESIIIRDHTKYDSDLERHLYNFFAFNVVKSVLFILTAFVLSWFFVHMYSNHNFVYGVSSVTFILIADSLAAPFSIYCIAKFNQTLVTKLNLFRGSLNLVFLAGVIIYPSLRYIAFKDLVVSVLFVTAWVYIISSKYNIRLWRVRNVSLIDFGFIKKAFFSYSIWTHLIGAMTNFIYRADTFFLSFFVGLSTVGNYNIALNCANAASIIPMIIGYQNKVALSHISDDGQANAMSNRFVRIALYSGAVTLIAFISMGKWYLKIVTGQDEVSDIYFYMILIVISLILSQAFTSPFAAFISVKGEMNRMFFNVIIPVFLLTFATYLVSSYLYGAFGIAVANVINSAFWLFMIVREIKKRNYDFRGIGSFGEDIHAVLRFLKVKA